MKVRKVSLAFAITKNALLRAFFVLDTGLTGYAMTE